MLDEGWAGKLIKFVYEKEAKFMREINELTPTKNIGMFLSRSLLAKEEIYVHGNI